MYLWVVGNMHCPSRLTVFYLYYFGRKPISFSIQESEIFPKTFLGLICSDPLWVAGVMKVSVFSSDMK